MNSSSSAVSLQYSPLEIRLNDLHFYAYHGVLSQERVVGGRFTLQILLVLAPSLTDVYELAKEVMSQPSQLLEHVAARLLQQLFRHFPQVQRATVEVQKDNPPMGADLRGCSVRLSATRAEDEA